MGERAYREISRRLRLDTPAAIRGRLTEQALARELAMSRTPVREALKRIEAAGLIRATTRGYVRVLPTPRDIGAEYEVRLLLEPQAAALAAANGFSTRQFDSERGLDFHLAVARCCGNAILSRSLSDVLVRSVTRTLQLVATTEDESQLGSGHSSVANAIGAGEPEAACAAMSLHLGLARALAFAALRRGN